MADEDLLKMDLGMVVDEKTGVADLAWSGGEVEHVSGNGNLRQALTLRILVGRGELRDVGHSRYGSHVPELIGEPLDRTNLELLRRYVRHALKGDPRVENVTSVVVRAPRDAPGIVYVDARVKAINDEEVHLALALDMG
jgi:phage baseplate assembly protein W